MSITDSKKSTTKKVPTTTPLAAAPVIHCELRRNKVKTEGRSVLVEYDNLKFFEDLTETHKSKLYGKLINEVLRHVQAEMKAGRLKIHFTK